MLERAHLLLLALAALVWPASARPCTTVALGKGEQTLVGKSYDFQIGHGLLVANKRNVAKQAALLPGTAGKPARWVSRFGSVTFDQYGREFPLGGINERGLVIEIMWLDATKLPALDAERPTVNELQWIQYLLDTTATVEEAVTAARGLQVARGYALVHYMVCDRSGACATLEYLEGKLVVHATEGLPVRALTNDPYAPSLAYLKRHVGFGGRLPPRRGPASLDRFVRVALAERRTRSPTVADLFRVLDSVRQGSFTQWQIVYEPGAGRLHFRDAGERSAVTVDLAAHDLDCGSVVKVMDLRGSVLGAATRKPAWAPYSTASNLKLVRLGFAGLRQPFPEPVIQLIARFPEMATRCASGTRRPAAD